MNNGVSSGLPSRSAIHLIRWYQRHLSRGRAASCRYLPTCSDYGVQAIQHHGIARGGAKTMWRLLRCNPLSAGGYDPPVHDDGDGAHTSPFHVKQPGGPT